MIQKVLPIKDTATLDLVKYNLLHQFRAGRRNYTIFQFGKATMLRISDIVKMQYDDIFDSDGNVRKNTYLHDKKTGKPNTIYLKPIESDLKKYQLWLKKNNLIGKWLFPSLTNNSRHISEKQYYKIISKVGKMLGIDYLGTHTMRKTGAYMVYIQSDFNIALVMDLLNHSTERMALNYLGLDQTMRESVLDNIDFD